MLHDSMGVGGTVVDSREWSDINRAEARGEPKNKQVVKSEILEVV